MSDTPDSKATSADVVGLLTEAMQSFLEPLPPTPPKPPPGQRSFRNAIGFFCLAPFCIVVAFLVWPSSPFPARLIWLGQAFLLLLAGAWQLDQSNKEAVEDPEQGQAFRGSQGYQGNVVSLPSRKQQRPVG